MNSLSRIAPPKINLTLNVTGRRADGYHLLDSLVVFGSHGDVVTVSEADNLEFSVSGPFSEALQEADDNLVIRAARSLQEVTGSSKGSTIELEKNLPIASGIGGGSADAAAALILLNQLWSLDLNFMQLADIGLKIGADIPACLMQQPLRMQGIGEELTPLANMPGMHLVLINPNVAVSTPAVFKALNLEVGSTHMAKVSGDLPLLDQLKNGDNDLQDPAIELVPQIATALDLVKQTDGCILSRMSGSGATVFGIFPDAQSAQDAASEIRTKEPTWWSMVTQTS